ncbi:hypothetical protein Dimus_005346 [Dionaea muscipula]
MEREHWRPAVETRRYKHRAATRGTGTLVSIFIDNLPENMNARDLFMLANRFTSVVDVFIPNKRRVVTKSRFGFVKVLRQTNADILIRKVNGLWVRDRMIVAKKAIRVSSPEGRGKVVLGTKPLHLHVEEERTQWLKCTGLPHQLWNHQNLTQVGKIWGEVLPGDHVLRMMAMAFGWVKIRTSALQPISQDVLLLNNGVSCRVHVNEETYFNPEQWVMGCKPKAQQVIFSGDRKEPEMVEEGFSSQRSFVPESPLSAGQREDAGFEADSGSLRMETTGRAFGPIPMLENTMVRRTSVQDMHREELGQEAQTGMASNFGPTSQNIQARSTSASQEIITRLGRQGKRLGESMSDPSSAATRVRSVGGGKLNFKRKGVLVRAAAEAMAGSQRNRMSQRDAGLFEEARSTWELGKNLGLVADASDGDVIQRIMQLELRLAPEKERRG